MYVTEIKKGQTFKIQVEATDDAGNPIDLSNYDNQLAFARKAGFDKVFDTSDFNFTFIAPNKIEAELTADKTATINYTTLYGDWQLVNKTDATEVIGLLDMKIVILENTNL